MKHHKFRSLNAFAMKLNWNGALPVQVLAAKQALHHRWTPERTLKESNRGKLDCGLK